MEVGYTVFNITKSKVMGITGMDFEFCVSRKKFYQEHNPGEKFDIRPVFLGSPVSEKVSPPITLNKAGNTA